MARGKPSEECVLVGREQPHLHNAFRKVSPHGVTSRVANHDHGVQLGALIGCKLSEFRPRIRSEPLHIVENDDALTFQRTRLAGATNPRHQLSGVVRLHRIQTYRPHSHVRDELVDPAGFTTPRGSM